MSAIEGFEEVKPMVFAGIYPVDTEEFEDFVLVRKIAAERRFANF
jgi:translation elongation factor EF-4